MNYSLIFDLILVAILGISAFIMSGKGLFKLIYKISSILITVIAVIMFSSSVEKYIETSPVGGRISQAVELHLTSDDPTVNDNRLSEMPDYIARSVNDIKENTVAPIVTDIIISLISAIIIYLIVKLLLYILFFFIKGIFKLPVLKQVNRLAGVCVGFVSGLIIVYIACGILSINISNSTEIRNVIDNTYILKYFYDNNLLMSIFINNI